jgi:hypothetical protein
MATSTTGCSTCGAPTTLETSEGGTTEGKFSEVYECANGHTGRVSGRAEAPAQEWNRTGAVFNDY